MANGGGSDINWECMLKEWSIVQGTRRRGPLGVYNDLSNLDGTTHCPAPQWRGWIQKYFKKHPPPPGYDIADRVYDIAKHFPYVTYVSSEDESESESEIESEDEEKKKKDGEVKKKKEGRVLVCGIDSDSDGIDSDSDSDSLGVSVSDSEIEIQDEEKEKEELLDELQAYVEFIDVASVLHSDERLFPLLHHVLPNKHAGIRAKGAEVVTTMVHKYPTSQQLVIKENGLKLLLQNFISDPDATSRTKALGAISSLIRNNEPCITEFRLANGYAALRDALSSESVGFQREVLNLIQYLLHENSSDCNIVTELGLPLIMMHLASNDDLEVREAALKGLLILARDEGGNSGQLLKNDDKLKQVLQARIEGISAMAPEDLGAAREERQLVDSLWNACYNEPSSLGEASTCVTW